MLIGIGASAGGLDAAKRLVGAMPAESGMALIIVMHLDPSHESHIAELLSSVTAMKVIQAADEQPIEPNHVYVIAPDRVLKIQDGVLRSTGPRAPHGDRKPVDTLFSSLAVDQKAVAVGIVLSGTGNNGSAGLQDIKAAGGLCIVQDPATAQFDGMPRSAIDTGVADYVVAPEAMPKILLDYAGLPEVRVSGEADKAAVDTQSAASPEAFDLILDLLGRAYNVNFRSAYKRGTLERRTERRMDLKHLSAHQDYLELLQKDPAEVAALYRDLLIGVTEFFRDPEMWAHLESDVIPGMLAQRDADDMLPLKVWVPGCATGEEAYSLAMVFLEQIERLSKSTTLQIFASDVADSALVVARRGLYPAAIEQSVSPERLSRFFHRQGDLYEVSREVREAVTFAAHNLLADPPFSRLDLVSCRNVLIYLEDHAQHRILQLFHFALKPGGLLLLGASETVGRQSGLFRTVSKKARVYRSMATTEGARHALDWTAGDSAPIRALPGAPTAAPRGAKVSRFIEQIVLSRYTRACVVVTESFEIQSFFGPTSEYLMQPTGEARMNVLAWARPGLYPRLRAALERAVEHKEQTKISDLRMERDGASHRVECSIEPITPFPGEAPLLLVAFREISSEPAAAESAQPQEPIVRQLEAELRHTREELQESVERLEGINEEYLAGHEELLSLNEELQSSNEELEASKEELQSLNEEMITINRQLEDKNVALQSASADINNLLVSTDIPIIFLDRELRIRRFTPAATELMHLIPSDLGRSVEHIKERFQNGGMVRDARRVLEKLIPVTAEIETEDGHWYARNLHPYRTEDDRIDGVSMSFHDITDRKRANEKIDEARLYAEAIVATVRTPLIVLDHDLRVVSANDCFYETFAVTRPETEHMRLFDLGNHQWDIAALRNLLERILPGHGAVENYEVKHHFEHLGPRIMHLNARLLKLNTIPPLILLAIEDVTEFATAARIVEERAEELTRESQRKDEFLAMLGHELRNPLSAMMHGLDLLGLAPRNDPEQLEQIRAMMTRQARRIGSLLEQLLDIARLSAGKVRMARVPVDLAEVVRTAVEAVMPRMEAQRHQFTVAMPAEESVIVLGDSPRLIQVLENLLTNAAKYTEAGGRIELAIEPAPREVQIRVRDSGIGMPAELLPHIFELFTQEAATLERSGGGLGLGLPLVKRVVEMHGGRVEATSPGRNQGSEFVVSLPRAPKEVRAAGADGPGKAKPRRILVVDDDEDSANSLAMLLSIQGHETLVAHDGTTALEAVGTFQPDVVLLDIGLPVMNGYEVARRLREDNPDKSIFLVALTGYGKETGRLRESGFDQHLIKPPDMQKLYGWLAGVETQEESAKV